MFVQKLYWLVPCLFLCGCIHFDAGDVVVKKLSNENKSEKIVTFLNDTPYFVEMSSALSDYGFIVKPMVSQKFITEAETRTKIAQFHEASARYGIRFTQTYTGFDCVLTKHKEYDFTLVLIDISENKVLTIIKQTGPDGPCSPINPVFNTMAEALAVNW